MISRAGMMPRAVEGVGMLTGKWESGGGGEEGSKEAGTHLSQIEREKRFSRDARLVRSVLSETT